MGQRSTGRGGSWPGGGGASLVQPGDKARIHIYHVINMAMGPPPFQTGWIESFSQTTFSNYYWKVDIKIRFKLFLELTRGQSNNPFRQLWLVPCLLPPIDSTDLLSYLVLQTSYITTQQFKANKSSEAYNQFVSGWTIRLQAVLLLPKALSTTQSLGWYHCGWYHPRDCVAV